MNTSLLDADSIETIDTSYNGRIEDMDTVSTIYLGNGVSIVNDPERIRRIEEIRRRRRITDGSTHLKSGNYSGVIVSSRSFTDRNGIDRFIIKVCIAENTPYFTIFIPMPIDAYNTHAAGKTLYQLEAAGYGVKDKDLIGEPVEFSTYNDCNNPSGREYTLLSTFVFTGVDLEEDVVDV